MNLPKPPMSGTFTPPADLGPAIVALDVEAFVYLKRITAGRTVTPADVVAAADWFDSKVKVAA